MGKILVINIIFILIIAVIFYILWSRWLAIELLVQKNKKDLAKLQKIERFKLKEKKRNFKILIISFLSLSFGLIGQSFIFTNKIELFNQHFKEVNSQITHLKNLYEGIKLSDSVKAYPEDGIGLNEINWEDLGKGDQQSKTLIEQELKEKLSHYLGTNQIFISEDAENKILYIGIISKYSNLPKQSQLEQNINSFIKELKTLHCLNQIKFQWNNGEGLKTSTINSNS